jgi:dipeptidyl aminopeptidase/acylaminoacyl peptidase
MMRQATAAVLTVLCLARPAFARPVTIDDLMKVRAISDLRISPRGDRVAYVLSEVSFERNAYEGVIYVVSASGGTPTRLTFATRIFNRPQPLPQLRWSPDSRQIAFLGFAGEVPQVFAISADGGEAHALTSAPLGVQAFEWSPDGKAIAYTAADPPSDEEQRRRKEGSFVIRVDKADPPTRLWLQPLPSGPALELTPEPEYVERFGWSPTGDRLVYASSLTSGFLSPYTARLFSVPRAGGARTTLVDRPGMNVSPQVSPDGRWVAFISTNGRSQVKAARGLAVVDSRGGAPRMLTTDGTWVGEFAWAADSASLFYLSAEGTFGRRAQMFEQPIGRMPVGGGKATFFAEGPTANYTISLDSSGSHLAYRSVASGTTGDVYIKDVASNRSTRLTDVNPELKQLSLGETRAVSWRSFDGMEIWGLLVLPPGTRTGRVPLLVYCHGGPIGGFTWGLFPQFAHLIGQVEPYPVQAMASAGFAILLPMPRGGSGYGEEAYSAIDNNWGGPDYRDIMAGVDYTIQSGIADPERLGVMGASYGGFMTSWIVTQTDRFKAASTGASVNDLASLYYLSEAGDFMIEYFKAPWEAPAVYAEHSALSFAANVKTPLLIQHGEVDPRVPLAQAREFYRALKAHGKTVEFDIYPRGGHVLREPLMQREQMRRNLEWFTRWLKPTSPTS